MSLTLYLHPLSSFCHKALIAFYENGTPFTSKTIDLGNPASRAELEALWPIAKFPVLRDEAKRRTIPESTTIIEYLALYYPGPSKLVPADPDEALRVRLRDRFFDNYVHHQMQAIVSDRLRPADKKDATGVEQARAIMRKALDMVEKKIAGLTWSMGDAFTMADCAAAPALFYANKVMPFGDTHKSVAAYLGRLTERPSYARALKEAEPFMANFPKA